MSIESRVSSKEQGDAALRQAFIRRLEQLAPINTLDETACSSIPIWKEFYRRGAYLHQPSMETLTCRILLSGFAAHYHVAPSGMSHIASIAIPGSLLNFDAALQKGVRNVAVQALSDVEAIEIPSYAVAELIADRPNVARCILADMTADLAILRQNSLLAARGDATSRVAHLLCEIEARLRSIGLCDGPEFPLPLTQIQISDAVGLTPVHVNRTLRSLDKQGLIAREDRRMRFLDREALYALSAFDPAYLSPVDMTMATEQPKHSFHLQLGTNEPWAGVT